MTRRLLMTFALVSGIATGATQAEISPPSEDALKEQVQAQWQAQHQALDAHDIEGVMATFADADDIMLMGTGPGEHWVGKEEVKDAFSHFMENFDPHTMEVKCGEGAGASRDTVVWVTSVCDFVDKKADEARHYILNMSAVLVEQGDAWRFHSMHFSNLTADDDAASQDRPQ